MCLDRTRKLLTETTRFATKKKHALDRIDRAGNAGVSPPIFESCLIDTEKTSVLSCVQQLLPANIEAFRTELFPMLEKLACESPWIAGGLIHQLGKIDPTEQLFGLSGRFAVLVREGNCKGLSSLSEREKNDLRDWARREEEERHAQSEAEKSAREVPASPTPPPAIAPATP